MANAPASFIIRTSGVRHQLAVAFAAVVAFAFSHASTFGAPGDLYSSDFVAAEVIRYSANGIHTVELATLGSALTGIAFDGKGNLFVAEFGQSNVTKLTPRGEKTTFATGLKVSALVFDRFGNLYASDENSNSILKFAPDGTKSTVITGLAPGSLAFDKAGVLYVAHGASGVQKVARGALVNFVTGLNAQGIAFNPDGDLFVAETSPVGPITRVTPTGKTSPFTNVPYASGLICDSTGNLFVSQVAGPGNILLVTPSGVVTTFATGGTAIGYVAIEPASHQLLNISTRGVVGTGDHVLIAGFIVGGDGQVDGKVIARALGPSLPIEGALQDPTLTLVNSDGDTVATNNDWKTSQQAAIAATGIPPGDDRESAIVASLPAGSYTAVVRGAGDTTGDALVEVYNIQ